MGKSQFCLILFFLVMAWSALAAEPDLIPFVAVAPDHWSFELRGGLSDTHSGKRALHVVIDPGIQAGQDYSEVSQRVDGIAAGPKLAGSVWVRGFDPDVRLVLVFRDRDGKELSDTSSPLAPAEQVWKLLKAEAVAPPGSYALNVSLQARAPGYVTFDDVSLLGAGLSNGGFENG
ncbi:MAG TPA: hypothetical protein VEN79_01760, partial [Terriglobia bacterium]|nr:hypothetical protein [Terriglobia bacterium]